MPVELRAGDGVVYTNFILHWPSNYGSKVRRTIHTAYQSFGGPLYRYFHLWWDLGFTKNLPPSLRQPFEHWDRLITYEHDLIEAIFRGMLDMDVEAFRKGLAALHPGEKGRMVCVVLLCKIAQKLQGMTRPSFAALPSEEQAQTVRPASAHLYDDVTRRFTADEIALVWRRFATLDAALQLNGERVVVGSRSEATTYRGDKMPANFEVKDLIQSWTG